MIFFETQKGLKVLCLILLSRVWSRHIEISQTFSVNFICSFFLILIKIRIFFYLAQLLSELKFHLIKKKVSTTY